MPDKTNKRREAMEGEERYSIALKNVQGHATFTGKPSQEQVDAVNKMAELAFYTTSKNKNMKSGIELIAEERHEQINKHGFDVSEDEYYKKGELKKAALYCLLLNGRYYPKNWQGWFKEKIAAKTLRLSPIEFDIEMLKIAGALIAAEIDRLQNFNHE